MKKNALTQFFQFSEHKPISPLPVGEGLIESSLKTKKLGEGYWKLIWILVLGFWISSVACAIPSKVFLNVPFIPQAPNGIWNDIYNEACEEAAIIMATRYVENKGLSRTEADKEILKLVDYQKKNYGGHFDLPVKKTAQLMKDFYKFMNFQIINSASIETMIDALSRGDLVIAPFAGRLLKNPYYKTPGPVYHMLLFKGYDLSRKEFIVNDPGTKRGLNYRFKFDVIDNAWHDWTGTPNNIAKGKKNFIVILDKKNIL
ncbi:C39 family peptidase [Candidatus Saganbacteria bacterium]|nr:C39 family peptidase [Candidatus Saganbacteria bacterium]